MRKLLSIVLLVAASLAGCSSTSKKTVPIPTPTSAPDRDSTSDFHEACAKFREELRQLPAAETKTDGKWSFGYPSRSIAVTALDLMDRIPVRSEAANAELREIKALYLREPKVGKDEEFTPKVAKKMDAPSEPLPMDVNKIVKVLQEPGPIDPEMVKAMSDPEMRSRMPKIQERIRRMGEFARLNQECALMDTWNAWRALVQKREVYAWTDDEKEKLRSAFDRFMFPAEPSALLTGSLVRVGLAKVANEAGFLSLDSRNARALKALDKDVWAFTKRERKSWKKMTPSTYLKFDYENSAAEVKETQGYHARLRKILGKKP